MLKNMKKVYTIGEALIDFIPHEIGVPIEEVASFKKMPGELLLMLLQPLPSLVVAVVSLVRSVRTILDTI